MPQSNGQYAIQEWLWPIPDSYNITQHFGSGHPALDISAPTGTPVRVPFSGTVEVYETNDGYGNYVVLHTDDGFTVILAHLHEILVPNGTYMNYGAWVAKSGDTGDSSGPHLHYEVRWANGYINPYAEIFYNFTEPSAQPPGGPGGVPPANGGTSPIDESGTSGAYPAPGGVPVTPTGIAGDALQSVISSIPWQRVALGVLGMLIIVVSVAFLIAEESAKNAIKPLSEGLQAVGEVSNG